MWIACLVLALQAPAAVPAPAFDASAARILLEQHSTAFGPGRSRSKLEVRRVAPIGGPVAAGAGYFVELAWVAAWADGDRPEVGVATVARIEELPADSRILGLDGPWALADLAVDKTWDDFMREQAMARAAAAEAQAQNALRGVLIGQTVFSAQAEAGGAFAGNLGCLAKPAECLEGYTGGPIFEMPADGIPMYELTLRGPAIAGRKPGLASAFVVTAVPSPPSDEMSAYCADASGRMCFLKDPAVALESACPAGCSPVE
jgi:hypothetical protein